MGMKENKSSGVTKKRCLQNSSRLDSRPIQGASVDFLLAQETIARIEEECSHDLLSGNSEMESEIARHSTRIAHRLALRNLGLGNSAPQLETCQKDRTAGVAEQSNRE